MRRRVRTRTLTPRRLIIHSKHNTLLTLVLNTPHRRMQGRTRDTMSVRARTRVNTNHTNPNGPAVAGASGGYYDTPSSSSSPHSQVYYPSGTPEHAQAQAQTQPSQVAHPPLTHAASYASSGSGGSPYEYGSGGQRDNKDNIREDTDRLRPVNIIPRGITRRVTGGGSSLRYLLTCRRRLVRRVTQGRVLRRMRAEGRRRLPRYWHRMGCQWRSGACTRTRTWAWTWARARATGNDPSRSAPTCARGRRKLGIDVVFAFFTCAAIGFCERWWVFDDISALARAV